MRKEVLAEDVEIWLGDCLECLPHIGQVAAIVTDPPYGIGYRHSGGGRWRGLTGKRPAVSQSESVYGDDKPFDPAPFLKFAPVCLFFGAQHFADRLPTSPHWIVWDKRHTARLSFGAADLAWTNAPGNIGVHRQLWNGCCVEGEERRQRGGDGPVKTRSHPTQKPVALMRYCIERATSGGAVLDPFMGSGATGVAAVQTGRRFVGVERVEKYFDVARRRLTEALDARRRLAA